MGALEFALVSTQSLAPIFILTVVGYVLGLKKVDLKALASININLLTPALLFAKITDSLDRDTFLELWFIPALYILTGFPAIWWTQLVGGRAMRLPDGFLKVCGVAIYFTNVNNSIIPIIESLVYSPGAKFLKRSEDDTPEQIVKRGVGYLMMVCVASNLLRWSVGMGILKPKTAEQPPASPVIENSDVSSLISDERTVLLSGANTPIPKAQALPGSSLWATVKKYYSPPVMGAAAGIAVLFVPPLHRALLTKGTFAYSFWYSTNLCSIACIPMVMIALGGQLALTRSQQPPTLPVSSGALIESGEEDSAVDSEVVTPHKQSQGTLLVVLGRYIIVPPITCLAMFLMMKMASGYFPLISNDPILFLTIAITSVTPPAVSLLTIAQNIGMYEDESARLLFHSYVIGVVAMAVEITIFLWLTSIIF